MANKENSVCGKATEVYSRIVGYFRPVSNWNKGKQQEFEDRKTYEVKAA
jgi:ribonucleoside-triphosphate reductase